MRKLYGLGGQPGIVSTGLPRISATGLAPVGLGDVDGIPPHEAHEPMAITAAASAAHSLTSSTAVLPPILQKLPPMPVGIAPSTTRMYLPLFAAIAARRASSAWWPAAAISVSW